VELCSKQPVRRNGVLTEASYKLLRPQPNFVPRRFPLHLRPVVLWESYSEAGIAHPIHEAQACARSNALSIMVLDQDILPSHATGLTLRNSRVDCVVQYVREQDDVERFCFKRKMNSVEDLHGNVGLRASKDIDAKNLDIWSFRW
jgi:hypothetical protein